MPSCMCAACRCRKPNCSERSGCSFRDKRFFCTKRPTEFMLDQMNILQMGRDNPLPSHPPKRVGILGGTFNPVHNGHMDIAEQARSEFSLDEVLLMVASDPPHKQASKRDLVPKEMRYEMAVLACEDHPKIKASPIELLREGRSYTVDTMRELKQFNPQIEYLFIIGEDTLYQLESWHDVEQLFSLTEFICLKRPIAPVPIPPTLEARRLADKYGAVIHLSDYSGPNISSSYIRDCLHAGRSIHHLVPKAVEDYIHAFRLYE